MSGSVGLFEPGMCRSCGEPTKREAGNAWYCWPCAREKQRESAQKTRNRQTTKQTRCGPRTPYMQLAHHYVAVAVRRGDLPALDGSVPCSDCGDSASQYDHRDYKRPLDVDPVCLPCHRKRGSGAAGHDFLLIIQGKAA